MAEPNTPEKIRAQSTSDLVQEVVKNSERLLESEIRLGQELGELQTRVRRMTEWREQFNQHTRLVLGLACGAGLLVGLSFGRE